MSELDVAVIGLSCRFPGAANAEEFWDNLKGGIESLSEIAEDELKQSGVAAALYQSPGYVKLKGIIPNIEWFDAAFFGYSPREAQVIDPQQRIFLEEAWNAFEQAGYNPEEYPGAVGVFAGCGLNTYLHKNLQPGLDSTDMAASYQAMIGNDKDFLATRVAYKLNLNGPALSVQTACSTSLVAIHLAAQSLLHGECDLALAGGVSLLLPQKSGYLYQEGMIQSPDGHCRTFDVGANGTASGSGVGVVLLKRLDDAVSDRDHIYAIIKGSAINNDGSKKVSFTAPSVSGQARVISEAQTVSGVHPNSISYIEAHGTGTPLGDPIELRALTQAFRRHTNRKGYCAIGSVKTNIGHLDSAAGVAGFIKTALSIQKGWLPASLNFKQANPQLDLLNSPFYVNTRLAKWDTENLPRRAGVSAFAVGGTNAHVVLEEMPVKVSPVSMRPRQLLLLSAKTPTALNAASANLSAHLQKHPDLNLADAAYTLQVGRKAFACRRFVVGRDALEAAQALTTNDPRQPEIDKKPGDENAITFLFPGQGSQYVNMGLALYQIEPAFRQEVDHCAEILQPLLGLDLRRVLYPAPAEAGETALQQTSITQPALFVIEYALAKLWISWGIQPAALIGHSLGEYVAACLAGVFSLEDALQLVALRARLMQQMPSGAMLAVQLGEAELRPQLGLQLSLAAVNAPNLCVVSGPDGVVQTLQNKLLHSGVACTRLHTSHAFHSAMMDPILAEFSRHLERVSFHSPSIPWVSTVTGDWVAADDVTNPGYWLDNIRQTVRFADAIGQVFKKAQDTKMGQILLEVGPGNTLTTLAKQHADYQPKFSRLHSLRHAQEQFSDDEFLLNTLGQLWVHGVAINWAGFYAQEERFRVPLPTYPFERQRLWVDAIAQQSVRPKEIVKLPNMADWFYIPSWKRSHLPTAAQKLDESCILLFIDQTGLGENLAKQLRQSGAQVITVSHAAGFARLNDSEYQLNEKQPDDYRALLLDLQKRAIVLRQVVHLWNITGPLAVAPSDHLGLNESIQAAGFYSLLYLAQALGDSAALGPSRKKIEIVVASNNMQNVLGSELLYPEKATLLGPVRVIPLEFSQLSCRSVDVLMTTSTDGFDDVAQQLISEINSKSTDMVVAYRGQYRWVQTFEPFPIHQQPADQTIFKKGGVYLITGGMGGIGLVVAEHLARTVQARLILIGRSAIPPAATWADWLLNHPKHDSISRKILALQKLESLGAQVWAAQADVTNLEQVESVLHQAEQHWGQPVQGVIHAAGLVSDEIIQFKTHESAAQILSPKLQGALVLEKVLRDRKTPLDFFLLFSSLASMLASPGRVDYCAANAFLDAFAVWSRLNLCRNTISLNWDGWEETGMSVEAAPHQIPKNGLLPDEALQALDRVLTDDHLSQVLISATNFSERYEKYLGGGLSLEDDTARVIETDTVLKPRPSDSLARNAQYVAPRTAIEKKLVDLWSKSLGVEDVGIQDNFFALGGHSLLAVSLVGQIRKQLGKKIAFSAFMEEGATVERLAQLIESSVGLQHSPLVQIKKGQGSPLILVHPIGGNVLCYNDLIQYLETDQPVYALQSLGMQGEQTPLDQIGDMAETYINALRTIQPEGPYLLAGWSMGGVVAFEMAHLLRLAGQDVNLLVLVDSWLPGQDQHLVNAEIVDALEQHAQWVLAFFQDMWQGLLPDQFRDLQEKLRILPASDQLTLALEHAQQLGLLSDDIDGMQIEHIFNVFKSNWRALWSYTPSFYPGSITFLRAAEETNIPASAAFQLPLTMQAWDNLTPNPIEIYNISGNHYSMFLPPVVQELAKIFSLLLRKAQSIE